MIKDFYIKSLSSAQLSSAQKSFNSFINLSIYLLHNFLCSKINNYLIYQNNDNTRYVSFRITDSGQNVLLGKSEDSNDVSNIIYNKFDNTLDVLLRENVILYSIFYS